MPASSPRLIALFVNLTWTAASISAAPSGAISACGESAMIDAETLAESARKSPGVTGLFSAASSDEPSTIIFSPTAKSRSANTPWPRESPASRIAQSTLSSQLLPHHWSWPCCQFCRYLPGAVACMDQRARTTSCWLRRRRVRRWRVRRWPAQSRGAAASDVVRGVQKKKATAQIAARVIISHEMGPCNTGNPKRKPNLR